MVGATFGDHPLKKKFTKRWFLAFEANNAMSHQITLFFRVLAHCALYLGNSSSNPSKASIYLYMYYIYKKKRERFLKSRPPCWPFFLPSWGSIKWAHEAHIFCWLFGLFLRQEEKFSLFALPLLHVFQQCRRRCVAQPQLLGLTDRFWLFSCCAPTCRHRSAELNRIHNTAAVVCSVCPSSRSYK